MTSPISISERAKNAPASPIRKLTPLADAAKAQGKRIYHLNIGQPDIRSPKEFFEGVRKFNDEIVAYEASKGSAVLCKTWAEYMNKDLKVGVKADQILITNGASEALLYAFVVACEPGDEVLVFDPTYANYFCFAAELGVGVIPVPCRIEDNFALPSQETIEAAITPRTRAIVLCNPNNPTGTVYSREELSRVLEIANRRNLFLIVDETYREFVYDNHTPLSVLHLEADNPRVIIVDSLSKRFSLCGARLGCVVTTNSEAFAAMHRLAQARLSAPSIEQFAAAYMLQKIGPEFVQQVRTEYQKRRDTLFSALSTIPGVVAHKPQGAFYTVVGLPVDDAEKFASYLLSDFAFEGHTTFVAPAGGFYAQPGRGKNEVRMAYVLESSRIERAVECLSRGLIAYTQGR